jgi:hypothetical protein
MHLFDDEEFTLADNIKRRKFFQPWLPGGDLSQRPQNVVVLNLTGRHFACEGATQFRHLNPETYDLVCGIWRKGQTSTNPSHNSCGVCRGRGGRGARAKRGD